MYHYHKRTCLAICVDTQTIWNKVKGVAVSYSNKLTFYSKTTNLKLITTYDETNAHTILQPCCFRHLKPNQCQCIVLTPTGRTNCEKITLPPWQLNLVTPLQFFIDVLQHR